MRQRILRSSAAFSPRLITKTLAKFFQKVKVKLCLVFSPKQGKMGFAGRSKVVIPQLEGYSPELWVVAFGGRVQKGKGE